MANKTVTPVVNGAPVIPVQSQEDLMRELDQLRAWKKATEDANSGELEFRVSEKGALSVYRLGRFPVTLYVEQWTKLIKNMDKLKSFIQLNEGKLKKKGE